MFIITLLSLFLNSSHAARVEIQFGKFVPSLIEVKAGETIEFVNTTPANHSVTGDARLAKNPANVILPEGAKPFDSGMILPSKTFELVLDVPGLYQYICLPHELHGMKGQILVVDEE